MKRHGIRGLVLMTLLLLLAAMWAFPVSAADSYTVEIPVEVIDKGKNMPEDTLFEVTIKAENGAPLPTTLNPEEVPQELDKDGNPVPRPEDEKSLQTKAAVEPDPDPDPENPSPSAEKVGFAGIQFTKAGDYTYTIYQEKNDNRNISLDSTVYTVKVRVVKKSTGGLAGVVFAYVGNSSQKTDRIVFRNTYMPPRSADDADEGEATPTSTDTDTGTDTASGNDDGGIGLSNAMGNNGQWNLFSPATGESSPMLFFAAAAGSMTLLGWCLRRRAREDGDDSETDGGADE